MYCSWFDKLTTNGNNPFEINKSPFALSLSRANKWTFARGSEVI